MSLVREIIFGGRMSLLETIRAQHAGNPEAAAQAVAERLYAAHTKAVDLPGFNEIAAEDRARWIRRAERLLEVV